MILIKLFVKTYNYDAWFENDKSNDTTRIGDQEESLDLSEMSALEVDEGVKEGKWLQILTPNKLLTRLSIVLAQIKTGKNSWNLKNEISQILYLLYQHNKITKKVYSNIIKSL